MRELSTNTHFTQTGDMDFPLTASHLLEYLYVGKRGMHLTPDTTICSMWHYGGFPQKSY